MSKNASSDFDKDRKPGNPQETLNKENFYYSGFLQQEVVPIFLDRYPLRQKRQKERLKKFQRILNDYTRNSSSSMERR